MHNEQIRRQKQAILMVIIPVIFFMDTFCVNMGRLKNLT